MSRGGMVLERHRAAHHVHYVPGAKWIEIHAHWCVATSFTLVDSQVCFTGTSSHKTSSSTTRLTFVVLSFVSSKLLQVRICDLGLARVKSPGGEAATGYVTTRWYRAPEV